MRGSCLDVSGRSVGRGTPTHAVARRKRRRRVEASATGRRAAATTYFSRIENPKAVFAFDRITLRAFTATVERYRCRDVGNFVAPL